MRWIRERQNVLLQGAAGGAELTQLAVGLGLQALENGSPMSGLAAGRDAA